MHSDETTNSADSSQLAWLGKLGRPHGLRGDLRFWPAAADFEWYFRLDPDRMFLLREGHPPQAARVRFRVLEGKRHILAKIENIESPQDALPFVGMGLAIPEGDRPAPQEGAYYADQLIGLRVAGPNGEPLGHVESVMEGPGQDFLSIRGESGTFLLSPDRGLIESVDLEAGAIRLRVALDFGDSSSASAPGAHGGPPA